MNQIFYTIVIVASVSFLVYDLYKTSLYLRETFTTGISYSECRATGYSKDFCVQTPVSLFGPAGCLCEDGSIGMIHPGLRGQCLCSRFY